MTHQAKGPFEVTLKPLEPDDVAEGSTLGRRSIEKQFHGALTATSKGQMLTAGSSVKGSAVYVAIERVTGTLDGRRGSFVLAHRGVMAGGAHELSVTVVPDSGSGELGGLRGSMRIEIVDGKHSYELDYEL